MLRGQFDNERGHVGGGVFYDVTYDVLTVNLELTFALPGDANGDGRVDGVDLGLWRTHRFGAGDWTEGDFSGDGIVDGTDFNIWSESRFQQTNDHSFERPIVPRAALATRAAVAFPPVSRELPTADVSNDRRFEIEDTSDGRGRSDGHLTRSLRNARRRDRSYHQHSPKQAPERWDTLVDGLFASVGDSF